MNEEDSEVARERERLVGKRCRYVRWLNTTNAQPSAGTVVAVHREPDDGEVGNHVGGIIWATYDDGGFDPAHVLEPCGGE